MSNIASDINYMSGKELKQWPNHSCKEPTDTALLVRQVYPDSVQVDCPSELTQAEESETCKQTYLDLGPATRRLVNVTENKK
jgi:hypothetical protein